MDGKENDMKGALAHEKGSGAPCLKCGPKCAGLDLHFWRKTCKNCRCKEEDHQVSIKKFDIQKSILETIFPGEINVDNEKPKPGQAVSFGTQTTPSEERAKSFIPQQEGFDKVEGKQTSTSDQDEDIESFPQPPTGLVFDNVEKVDVPRAEDKTSPDIATFAQALEDLDMMAKHMEDAPKEKSTQSEEGRQYRQKQLSLQLPAYDFDENLCDDLTDEEKMRMKEFNKKRNQEASGKGAPQEQTEIAEEIEPCVNCNKKFQGGDVVIFADRAGPDRRWHPDCFVCHTCKELLVDLIYFYKDENIYCGRHYGELTGLRCNACDELIFSEEYTIADGKNYHLKHFCCYECDKELGGESYVPKDDHPYCMNCYRIKFSKTCQACQQSIPPDVQCLSYEDYYWHSSEACFSCCVCNANLIGQQFIFKDKKAYCSAECVAK